MTLPMFPAVVGNLYRRIRVSEDGGVGKGRSVRRGLALVLVGITASLGAAAPFRDSRSEPAHSGTSSFREEPNPREYANRTEGLQSLPEDAVTRWNRGTPPATSSRPTGSAPAAAPACPANMVLVRGEYCTEVEQTCKSWMDDEKLPYARCARYDPNPKCVGQRVAMSFCIDRYEYTRPGEALPKSYGSFVTATQVCAKLGKRVCTESEWNFACEGEEMRPYPYGFSREPKCNQDQADLFVRTQKKLLLKDLRARAGDNPECVSPFGVFDMVGNMDEPVLREGARYNYPFRNALKGGWWMSGRNRCRPSTTAHDDNYADVQVGIRCCADNSLAASSPPG